MNNDLIISFFDCCRTESDRVLSCAGAKILPGTVFSFASSCPFGSCFSLSSFTSETAWRIVEDSWSRIASICFTVNAMLRSVSRRIAAAARGRSKCLFHTGRRILAQINILRI